MKRDLNLIREILLRIEKTDDYLDLDAMKFDGKTDNEVAYNTDLLIHHGLVDGKVDYAWGGDCTSMTIKALTWDGYDYLDSMRDKRVFSKAKDAIKETIGCTSLGVFKYACELAAKELLKQAF